MTTWQATGNASYAPHLSHGPTERRATPRISVLMPVFNAERYVAVAMESILGQTLEDFELIIVDDGSSDSSLQIVTGYAKADSRIRLYSRPNAGLVATLNEMLSVARGSLIARMDADDLSHPTRFERQVAFLDSNTRVAALGCQGKFIDPDGDPLMRLRVPTQHEQIQVELMATRLGIIHPAAMLRRDVLVEVGGYRNGFPACRRPGSLPAPRRPALACQSLGRAHRLPGSSKQR